MGDKKKSDLELDVFVVSVKILLAPIYYPLLAIAWVWKKVSGK